MGYRLTDQECSTLKNWSKSTAASGAAQADFAPVLQLLQSLIGRRKVEQVERATSRAYPQHPAAEGRTAPAACRPSARLITGGHEQDDRSPARQTCGRGRLGRPPHSIMRVANCNSPIINAPDTAWTSCNRQINYQLAPSLAARVIRRVFMLASYPSPRSCKTNPRPSYGLCLGLIFPCASRAQLKRDRTPHNPLRHSETQRCHHLSDDQREGFQARFLSAPFTLLQYPQTPARRPGRWRNVEAGEMHRIDGQKTGGSAGVGAIGIL